MHYNLFLYNLIFKDNVTKMFEEDNEDEKTEVAIDRSPFVPSDTNNDTNRGGDHSIC